MFTKTMIDALWHFLKMLNLKSRALDSEDKLQNCFFELKNVLENGKKAISIEGDYTPLMLYACFDIYDERFESEVALGKDHVLKTKTLILPEHPSPKISAMTFALAFQSFHVVEKLYNLDYFSKEHLEEAVFFSVSQNALRSVKFLCEKNVYLFRPMLFSGKNAFHLACHLGLPEIVKTILDTVPSDEDLALETRLEQRDALSYAIQSQNAEVIELIRQTKLGLWDQFSAALRERNLERIRTMLEANCDTRFWKAPNPHSTLCILGGAYEVKIRFPDPLSEDIYAYCKSYIRSQPYEIQINSALLAINNVMICASDLQGSREENFFIEMIKEILQDISSFESHFSEVNELIINGLELSQKQMDMIAFIIEKSPIKKLNLAVYNPDVFDQKTDEICTINMWVFSAQLVSACLHSTTLIDCDLVLMPSQKPLMDLFKLILERNNAMSSLDQDIVKEWVFNKYVDRINRQIQKIQADDNIQNKESLKELSVRKNTYSLQEMLAFRIANQEEVPCRNLPEATKELMNRLSIPEPVWRKALN